MVPNFKARLMAKEADVLGRSPVRKKLPLAVSFLETVT